MENEARGTARKENSFLWSFRILESPFLRKRGLRCFSSIMKNFFFLQYMQAVFKRRPVAQSDHPLDEKIPFTPAKVNIYLDFIAYWIRAIGFMLRSFGRQALAGTGEFIDSIGDLYKKAAEVYTEKFSTTRRPRYLARMRFITIHTFDPHLMCIPSLHVMIVIRTYTFFREAIRRMGTGLERKYSPKIEEVRRRGIAITEAVLYVKQHSVNCISAAMYAMTCFDPALFPPEEGERFVSELFVGSPYISAEDQKRIREYILGLYKAFLSEGKNAPSWKEPLMKFLDSLPVSK
ncbi:MAG: hypothetical protein LBH43_15490 [Treponema sp.]|jgi:hypothetical protein|nr:hypothetical protein [Treponema sp.]